MSAGRGFGEHARLPGSFLSAFSAKPLELPRSGLGSAVETARCRLSDGVKNEGKEPLHRPTTQPSSSIHVWAWLKGPDPTKRRSPSSLLFLTKNTELKIHPSLIATEAGAITRTSEKRLKIVFPWVLIRTFLGKRCTSICAVQ